MTVPDYKKELLSLNNKLDTNIHLNMDEKDFLCFLNDINPEFLQSKHYKTINKIFKVSPHLKKHWPVSYEILDKYYKIIPLKSIINNQTIITALEDNDTNRFLLFYLSKCIGENYLDFKPIPLNKNTIIPVSITDYISLISKGIAYSDIEAAIYSKFSASFLVTNILTILNGKEKGITLNSNLLFKMVNDTILFFNNYYFSVSDSVNTVNTVNTVSINENFFYTLVTQRLSIDFALKFKEYIPWNEINVDPTKLSYKSLNDHLLQNPELATYYNLYKL